MLDAAEIRAITEAFEASGWHELRLVVGETVVHLASSPEGVSLGGKAEASGAEPTAVPAGGEEVPARRETGGADTVIRSPTIGLFWRAPHPGAAPFVEVGDLVEPDSTLCIVEVMKLMNPLKAAVHGVVTEIVAVDGQVLARDEALFSLRILEP